MSGHVGGIQILPEICTSGWLAKLAIPLMSILSPLMRGNARTCQLADDVSVTGRIVGVPGCISDMGLMSATSAGL